MGVLATLLAQAAAPFSGLMLSWHPPSSLLAVGFSVLLVSTLVAVEEMELRRGRTGRG